MVENRSTYSCLRSFPLELERDGFAILDNAVAPDVIAELRSGLPAANSRAGLRNLLAGQPAVRTAVRSPSIRRVVEAVLGPRCFAVRAMLFDKTPEANWKVAWHQDLTIAVHQRRCMAGFTAWSEKEGVVHVQPPVPVLERMLAVRVHLDDCGPDSGPLRILPGSHREGRLDASAIDRWKARVSEVQCLVGQSDLVLMRPLVLHASSAAQVVGQRRVLHLEFAADELPGNLKWHDRF
jgi:ectoine hydroxylase-related dioxygenase (phytanoyl-CoA dioxygenase family)